MNADETIKTLNLMLERGQNRNNEAIKNAIRAVQEQVSKKTAWILTSERLPDNMDLMLISGRHKEIDVYANDLGRWNGRYWSHCGHIYEDFEILAWMPLPEPYKGADNE